MTIIERHSSSSSRVTSWSKCKNLITVTEVCTKIYLTTGTSHTHHLKIHKVKTWLSIIMSNNPICTGPRSWADQAESSAPVLKSQWIQTGHIADWIIR